MTAQLVSATTGEHVWSERYDRQVDEFFAVQDEITEKIAATLTGWQSPISQARKAAASRKSLAELGAYDYWLLGAAEKHRMTPASLIEARKLFERGLALDAGFQPLVRDLGYTYTIELWMGAAKDPEVAMRKTRGAFRTGGRTRSAGPRRPVFARRQRRFGMPIRNAS